jgi:polysaccharide pyruvyl transferase WcaK-like protein
LKIHLRTKISYAANSTIKKIDMNHKTSLAKSLSNFSWISVRNKHSYEFVKSIINKNVPIVENPAILYHFNEQDQY